MPRLLESDAEFLTLNYDALSPENQAKAQEWFGNYRQQQADEGEPLFPTQEKTRAERQAWLRSMFEAPDKIDYDPGPMSLNPELAKMQHANMALLSARYQKEPAEVASRYDFLLNDYARQKLGASEDVDTAKFYALAQKDMQKVKLREDTQREGMSAALRGEDGVKALAAWQVKNADRAKDDAGLFMRGYQQALEQDGEMLPIADRLLKALESGTDKTGQNVQANMDRGQVRQELGQMVEQLAGMKKAQRKSVYRSIAARIEAAGYDQKGFWSQMLGELDKGLYRMEGTLGTSAGIASDVATAVAGAQTRIPDTFDGSSVSMPVLSDEEQQALLRQRDYRERIGNVQEEIMQIVSGELDPVKPVTGWMNETVETGLIKGPGAVAPFMAASALLGPYGAGLVFTADFAEQNRRELVQNGLDADQARKVGAMAAPLQAAVESLSNMVSLGKFPAVQSALSRFTRPVGGASLVGRYVQNSLISGATEFTEEQVQDNVVVPAMQELLGALEKDVPEVDWSFYKTRAANATPELAATLLPMALVFGGVMTAADAKLSRTMTQNVTLMMSTGMDQAQAVEVASQPTQEQRIRKGAELWSQRKGTKASMEEAQKKLAERLKALSGDAVAYQAELERRGVLPRVMHTAENDWLLTFNDGSTARFATHDEASTARWTWAEDQLGRVHALTREALSSMERNMSTNRELGVEFKPDVRMVEAGQATPDIQRRVEQGKVLGDIDPNEAFDTASMVDRATAEADGFLSSYQILGSSRNEFKDGVLRTTIKLWEGSNVLTLVEEKLEGDAKAIVASRGGRGWMLAALRNYEQESGDKVFREVPDDQLTDDDLVEAWSHLGQSYLVGRSSFGEPLQQNNMRRFSRLLMRAGLAGALNSESTFWQAVVNRAQKLGELKAAGKLNEDVVAELEKQLGIDSQVKHEQGAMQEAQNVANEVAQQASDWVDDSQFDNLPPSNDTFSMASASGAAQANEPSPGGLSEADAEYLDAVNRGDMEKVQRMVDEAAKAAGAGIPKPVSNAELLTAPVFWRLQHPNWALNPDFKSSNQNDSDQEENGLSVWSSLPELLENQSGGLADYARGEVEIVAIHGEQVGTGIDGEPVIRPTAEAARFRHPNLDDYLRSDTLYSAREMADNASELDSIDEFLEEPWKWTRVEERPMEFDPVTYDDAGNIIPPSRRFDAGPDIRGNINPESSRAAGGTQETFAARRAIPADASKVVQMPDGARLVGPTTFSIRAYHGTPHKVDKFSLSKIGTGEGAQAYGWGLYFAEKQDVAEGYQSRIAGAQWVDKTGRSKSALEIGEAVYEQARKDGYSVKDADELRSYWSAYAQNGGMQNTQGIESIRAVVDGQGIKLKRSGNLYTVELLPDADEFLDWDKPLSEQSEKVKAAIQPFTKNLGDDIFPTGGALYSQFIAEPRGEQKASEKLASLGIPGIRYLDGGSRGAGDGTRNFVIFDENLVRILEENGKPVAQETFSLRVTPAQDAEYMAAVEAGDMDKAQRLVDSVRLKPREVFYVGNTEVVRNPNDGDYRQIKREHQKEYPNDKMGETTRFTTDKNGNRYIWRADYGMHSMIEPGIEAREKVAVGQNEFNWNRKSADPVTYDSAGNVIPLSQRFNPADNRITFSIRPGDFSARMAAKFSLFQAKPELRLAITQVAKERALRLGAEWIAKGDVIRSAKDIGKEARMREALAYEARMNEYLDGLSENARQTLEFEPSALEDDPLVAAMLDFGKLMSFTTAKKSGKVEAKSGDYDGQPWLPPAWFSKGAGIMPDQMAQAMFDAGMLPDAYTGTLWSELEKRIEATRKDKAAHREAVQAYKAAEKYARDASRAEADQWAENAKKQAGSPKAQRDMLKAALRTLDGILAAAPPEVRARVGGYVKLAGLATDEAMLQEIERRIDKLNVELEKDLKKQAVAEITKLFKKARPDMEAGKKGKGKDADMHALFAAAEAAADMDALAVAGRLADLDARIASGELTSEQEALAMTERGIVELVGDLKNADSGRAFSALDTLSDIYGGAWLKWKIAEIERKERRAGLRQDFIEATGKAGVRTERTKADKVNESLFGKGKAWLLNLSSMREVLAYAFGLDNERVTSLVDAERTASNTYEDANQRLGDEIEGLFTAMAGTRTKGERLRWNLSQRTIKTGKGELSQLEAIQALLMWRQEDGRRHMEGTRDESGKVTSSWSYDQAWIDEIEAALTPEARQVMSFIMGKYAAEWATLNPLYRARYGVNMPHHDAYAPITVTPVQTKAGEVVDPVTGSAVSGGSILTPGSLRTRSRNAIAEPDFRDALQTMILHSRQMEYWKAYYDLAVEMNAVLGNREVMNSVHAKGGKEAANALRQWIDVIGQGGFRDASLRLALFQAGSKLQGRAAGVALLGRMSAILSQSTQLAAAAVKMPVTSYLVRLAKLMTGGLGWRDAMRSDFIQRRFKTAPPIVRQAMDSLASAKPNEIQQLSRFFGNVLSGADAFFTSGTYAILLDYHREQGRAAGLTGAELDAYAHTEAERATEQVAQPLRTANRSLAELSNTGPLGKIGWAFASEARQKVALAAHAALNAKNDPVTAAKSAFLTFAIGGLFTQVLKNLLREAKGDDDGEMWSLGRLGYAMTIAPLASAIPFGSAIAGDSNMLSNIQRAIQTLGNEEVDFRDVDAMLSAAGLFNDTAASLAQLSHLGLDLGKILANAAD